MAVISSQRPVLAFNPDGSLEKSQTLPEWTDIFDGARGRLETIAQSVGRVEAVDHPTLSLLGAAFVVAPGLVMTTGHISDVFLNERNGRYQTKPELKVRVRFSGKHEGTTRDCPIVDCALRHPVLDVAILKLGDDGGEPLAPLAFHGVETLAEGTPLAVIAFFSRDPREKDLWPAPDLRPDGKYLAPGRFLSFDTWNGNWALAYDCSTSVGSSGGPVIDIKSGAAVGMHIAGQVFKANYAVPASEIAREVRMRDLGLTFTEASLPADPASFAAEWPDPGDSPASDTAPPRARDDQALVGLVEQRLRDKYPKLDDAVKFIRDLSADYASAVDAQPGRGRVDSSQYRHALVEALYRRSLLDDRFLKQIGLGGETDPDPADAPVVVLEIPHGAPEPGEPAASLSSESLDQLAKVLGQRNMNDIVRGSPYVDLLTEADGTLRSFDNAASRLASAPDPRSREALLWLLKHVRLDHRGTDIPAVTAALSTLGFTDTEPDVLQALIPKPTDLVDLSFLRNGQIAARSVCVVKGHSAGQGGSTGWLLAPDLIVAPAHITSAGNTSKLSKLDSIEDIQPDSFEVEFEDDGPDRKRTVHKVSEIESLDHRIDLMILRLATPLTDRAPLQLRTARIDSGPVAMIHHPHLGRRMLSIHGGRLLSNDGHEVRYLLASAPGSAGGPVFDEMWHVVATHRMRVPARAGGAGASLVDPRSGAGFVKLGTSVEALIDHVRGARSYEQLWRRIVGAQRPLRSIDPGLLSAAADGRARPVVITLVDASTTLPDLTGLTVSMRSGDLVTATVTPKAVRRLAETPGVVGIADSRAVAGLECRVSVPFIGVPAIHTNWGEEGEKAIIAVIDNGVDPFHPAFLDANPDAAGKKTRIDLYWDQQDSSADRSASTATQSPDGAAIVAKYGLKGGKLYIGPDIDAMMANPPAALRTDVGHGTAVASIAAGRRTGAGDHHFAGGVAPQARLIVIRYDPSLGYPVGHINALALIDRRATDLGLPVVVNISTGMNAGAHDGSTAIEKQCTEFTGRSSKPGRVIVKSAGNERNSNRHAQFSFTGIKTQQLKWDSQPRKDREGAPQVPDHLELWFGNHNVYEFMLQTPDRGQYPIPVDKPVHELLDTRNEMNARYSQYAGETTRRSKLVLDIFPGKKVAVQGGEWILTMRPINYKAEDQVHAWLEISDTRDVKFKYLAFPGFTITVPGTSNDVITVAAMTANAGAAVYQDGSMGPTLGGLTKPDILAPGVNIVGAWAGKPGDAMPKGENGTSFAAPHVTGVIALALSAFQKNPPADGAEDIHQSYIRDLLLNFSQDFNLKGDPESGFGRLAAEDFFRKVEERIARG
jgi:endonuclease G